MEHYISGEDTDVSDINLKSLKLDLWNEFVFLPQWVSLTCLKTKQFSTTVHAIKLKISQNAQVGLLFIGDDGTQKANSSDSSRFTQTYGISRSAAQRGQLGLTNNPNIDTNLMSNIHKLFCERIEVGLAIGFFGCAFHN